MNVAFTMSIVDRAELTRLKLLQGLEAQIALEDWETESQIAIDLALEPISEKS